MKARSIVAGSVLMLAVACGGSDEHGTGPADATGSGDAPSASTADAPAPPSGGNEAPGDPPSAAPEDQSPPTIAEVEPANGAVGVVLPSSVKLTFSRPMDRASTEAAFKLGAGTIAGTFAWSNGYTVLEFTPNAPLPNGLDAIVELTPTAKAQNGVALAEPFVSTFRTLRKTTVALPSKVTVQCSTAGFSIYIGQFLVGDDAADKEFRAFATFDLSSLPEDLTSIDEAKLTLSNATVVGPIAGVAAESVSVGQSVDCSTDFASAPRSFLNPFTQKYVDERLTLQDKGAGTYEGDALLATTADWADRAALGKRVVLRIQSSVTPPANGTSEGLRFDGSVMATRPHLSVTYQHP